LPGGKRTWKENVQDSTGKKYRLIKNSYGPEEEKTCLARKRREIRQLVKKARSGGQQKGIIFCGKDPGLVAKYPALLVPPPGPQNQGLCKKEWQPRGAVPGKKKGRSSGWGARRIEGKKGESAPKGKREQEVVAERVGGLSRKKIYQGKKQTSRRKKEEREKPWRERNGGLEPRQQK